MGAQSSTGINIAVSACLLGERVRYDGAQKRHSLIMQLAQEFTLLPFCPEVAIGLGVPRTPVQLVMTSAGIRARGVTDSDHDISDRLQAYAREQSEVLMTCAGLILKSRSPSCGLGSTPLFNEQNEPIGKTNGLFAAALQNGLPELLMVEESALSTDNDIRVFVERVRHKAAPFPPTPLPFAGEGLERG